MHMKLDLARLWRRVVDVLVSDLAKFFDVIAHDVHPIVGPVCAWVTPDTQPTTRTASRMPYR